MTNDSGATNKKWTLPKKTVYGTKIGILKKILKSFSFKVAPTVKEVVEIGDGDKTTVPIITRKNVSFDESTYYSASEPKNKSKNNSTDPILCKVKIYDTATPNRVAIRDITGNANSSKQTTISEYETPNTTTTNFGDCDKKILEDLTVKTCNRSGICIGEEYEQDFIRAIEGVKTSTVVKRSIGEKDNNLLNLFVENHLDEKTHKNLYHHKKSEEDKFVVNLYESYGRKCSPPVKTVGKINNGNIRKIVDKPLLTNKSMGKPPEMQKMQALKTDNKMYEFLSLKQEADVQCEIMRQASKGLDVFKNTRNVSEKIELERVLLIASYKHHAIIEQIRENEYSEIYQDENRNHKASVSIRNLQFPLNPKRDLNKRHNEWFVCIISSGTKILFTKATKRTSKESVSFEETFIFENLKSNLTVNISLYVMVVEKPRKNPLTRQHLSRQQHSNGASYKKFFHKSVHTYEAIKSDIRISSFQRVGFSQLKRNDFFRKGPWILQNLPKDSPIVGTFTCDLRVEKVDVYGQFCGFLTISTKTTGSTIWNRKWGVLDKTVLSFWNSPTEEGLNRPVLSFDLKDCLEPQILLADRNSCPRPRTMVLELWNEETSEKRKVYLSADTTNEMEVWKNELNAVIKSLAKWKMLNNTDNIIT